MPGTSVPGPRLSRGPRPVASSELKSTSQSQWEGLIVTILWRLVAVDSFRPALYAASCSCACQTLPASRAGVGFISSPGVRPSLKKEKAKKGAAGTVRCYNYQGGQFLSNTRYVFRAGSLRPRIRRSVSVLGPVLTSPPRFSVAKMFGSVTSRLRAARGGVCPLACFWNRLQRPHTTSGAGLACRSSASAISRGISDESQARGNYGVI